MHMFTVAEEFIVLHLLLSTVFVLLMTYTHTTSTDYEDCVHSQQQPAKFTMATLRTGQRSQHS